MKHFFLLLSILVLPLFASAQQSSIKGVVIDEANGETLPFASVVLENTTTGSKTDLDGAYSFPCNAGTYNVVCSYVGYDTQTKSVTVKANAATEMSFSLVPTTKALIAVVVTAQAVSNSVSAVNALVQKTPAMLTGISRDDIRRTPDRSSSDVLKRLSGTSVQDNRYVVVRGLNDRYNVSLVNGFMIPSSEPDRRAFAFDLFPSSMLDNLIIYKTASPDLPGEFAGGVVLLNTREIPESNFFQVSAGTTYNTQSTFKSYLSQDNNNLDWLGINDGSRNLPDGLESTAKFKKNTDNAQKSVAQSKLFSDANWEIQRKASMPLARSLQLTGARSFKMKNDAKLGVLGALTYSNTPRFLSVPDRINAEQQGINNVNVDEQYLVSASLGGMLNLTYQVSPTTRILLNNVANFNNEHRITARTGNAIRDERFEENSQIGFIANQMINTQLRGEHNLNGTKVNWGFTRTALRREMPGMLTNFRTLNYDAPEGAGFTNFVSPFPNPFYASMFYSDQKDNALGFNADVTIPFALLTPRDKNSVKIGVSSNYMTRTFDARIFAYTTTGQNQGNPIFNLDPSQSFTNANIDAGLVTVKEATVSTDAYDATQLLPAAFAMADLHLSSKFRVTAGARLESFSQDLTSFLAGGEESQVNAQYTNLLPSINTTYSFTERSRLRASASRTVSRPTFREMALFSYFSFDDGVIYVGNPDLKQANITNLDLRYEFFPASAQILAIGAFYKNFQNPIEQIARSSTAFGREISYINSPTAVNSGVEAEFRIKPFQNKKVLGNFTVMGNFAYINSIIDLSNFANAPEKERPLQGQSPYVANLGLNYNMPNSGTDVTFSFNRIGRRIWQVGYDAIPSIWEAPRSVLDFNITQRFLKNGELRFSVQDILNQKLNFYMDIDKNGRYNPVAGGNIATGDDQIIQSFRFGTNISLSASWRFAK